MTEAQKAAIRSAVMMLLAHGFTVTGPGGKSAGPTTAAAAPPKVEAAPKPALATTVDGRHAYTCGKCGNAGHNARTHDAHTATAAPQQKTQAISSAAKVGAGVKAAPVKAAPSSVALDDLSFDLSDLGGVESLAAPKAAPKMASKPRPAAPPPPPVVASEAADSEVDDFLAEIDNLDALLA